MITIGPSTVGTTTNTFELRYPAMRGNFYAVGLHWVFYSDGTNLVFRSSVDGSSWSAPTTVRTCIDGRQFSLFFDGTYVHYAFCPWTVNNPLNYRRGQPNSDGSITWSAVEQIAVAADAAAYYSWLVITVDSNGCAYIAYFKVYTTFQNVTKNVNIDGTWSTAAGFPLVMEVLETSWASILPLTDGKVYLIWTNSTGTRGKLYSGGAWQDQENVGYTINSSRWSASVFGDDVLIAFHKTSDRNIYFGRRIYDSGWIGEVLIYDGTATSTAPNLAVRTNGQIYVWWLPSTADPTAHQIFYKKSIDNGVTWTDEEGNPGQTNWINESGTNNFASSESHRSSGREFGGKLGLVWLGKTVSPYNIRYAAIDHPIDASNNLASGFFVNQYNGIPVELKTGFISRQSGSHDLWSRFRVNQFNGKPKNLRAGFHIRECYNFSGGLGISFYWWGSGTDFQVDLTLVTPTGSFIASYPDGPAKWRWVFLPWSQFAETGLDGSRPDKSMICCILWTIHRPGIYRIDRVSVWRGFFLKAGFAVKQPGSQTVKTGFAVKQPGSQTVKTGFAVKQPGSQTMKADFTINP